MGWITAKKELAMSQRIALALIVYALTNAGATAQTPPPFPGKPVPGSPQSIDSLKKRPYQDGITEVPGLQQTRPNNGPGSSQSENHDAVHKLFPNAPPQGGAKLPSIPGQVAPPPSSPPPDFSKIAPYINGPEKIPYVPPLPNLDHGKSSWLSSHYVTLILLALAMGLGRIMTKGSKEMKSPHN
jgi:hypothetical protein